MASWDPRAWSGKTKILAVAAWLIIIIGAYTMAATSDGRVTRALRRMPPATVQFVNDTGQTITVNVRVANDAALQATGLQGAGSRTIAETVLLYPYARARTQRYDFPRLRAPIDVAIVRQDGTISAIVALDPAANRTDFRAESHRYAVLAARGWFATNGMSRETSSLVVDSIRYTQR